MIRFLVAGFFIAFFLRCVSCRRVGITVLRFRKRFCRKDTGRGETLTFGSACSGALTHSDPDWADHSVFLSTLASSTADLRLVKLKKGSDLLTGYQKNW